MIEVTYYRQYNRVTIGTPEEMAAFLEGVKEIMKEEGLA